MTITVLSIKANMYGLIANIIVNGFGQTRQMSSRVTIDFDDHYCFFVDSSFGNVSGNRNYVTTARDRNNEYEDINDLVGKTFNVIGYYDE